MKSSAKSRGLFEEPQQNGIQPTATEGSDLKKKKDCVKGLEGRGDVHTGINCRKTTLKEYFRETETL